MGFEVGDKVTCQLNGRGIVINISDNHWGVEVYFYGTSVEVEVSFYGTSVEYEDYTHDGRMYTHGEITLHKGHGTFKFVPDSEANDEKGVNNHGR